MAFKLQLREDRPATIEEHRALRAEIERLRAVLTDARSFVEGMVKPAQGGVMQISSYHPCHALIDKINAALASTREQSAARCDMCGEPKDGRDHSGCDRAYPETLQR